MSYEPVDFIITDNTPSAAPIQGVVVKIWDQGGVQVFGEATTDSTGTASFLLPSDVTLQARFYKQQVNIKNPQLFVVQQAPAVNTFEITGELFAPPTATDPHLCMCYGFFKDITGAPATNLTVQIISQFDPLLFNGAAVMVERVTLRTDSNGYLQVPLIRNGQYEITVAGFEDLVEIITVPDAVSANLPDLIFPVVGFASFSPAGPYTCPVNGQLVLTPTMTATDGEVLTGTGTGAVRWSLDDETKATLVVGVSTLTIQGVAAGVVNLTAVRMDTSIVRYPDPGIIGVPIQITIQ